MKPETPLPANSSDFRPVALLFADHQITELFSELLQSRGIRTRAITSTELLPPESRIITEPQFLSTLTPAARSRCLVVGASADLCDPGILSLSRPLTEEKVEFALRQLLGQ